MQPEEFFPISLDIGGQLCLVIGGGDCALAKIRALLRSGAVVRILADTVAPALRELIETGRVEHLRDELTENTLNGIILAIDSGEEPQYSQQIRKLCRAHRILLNSVDQPEHCDFHVPAVVRRGPVQVAISTGGSAPALARNLRQMVEGLLPRGLEHLVRQAAAFRPQVQSMLSMSQQKTFWNRIFALDQLADHIGSNVEETLERLNHQASCVQTETNSKGEVWLVGAGAGSADLITLRGLRAIEQADVILHDALIDDALLDHARRDARLMPVGKRCGRQSSPQDFINRTLANLARQGMKVVRLKCGDPFIFGRGGEELDYLKEQKVETHIIPGVTAASVAASVTGIPLTHRGVARRITFMTAATNSALAKDKPDWQALLSGGTVALYMARNKLDSLSQEMVLAGISANLPVCIVSSAGLAEQQVFTTTLADLGPQSELIAEDSPVLALVGETAAHADFNTFQNGDEINVHPSYEQLKDLKASLPGMCL
jgi:uroporphyrin-III C-methyltransferase/precorrin-2 dehydrogenase/sirohydrochlorin ferrochelatase